jgi:hypothetical protein
VEVWHFCCIFSSLCIDTLSIALKEYKLAMLEVLLELLDPGLEPHMITVRVHHKLILVEKFAHRSVTISRRSCR